MESNGYGQTEALLEPLAHINREQLAAMADAAVADHHSDFGPSSPSSPGPKRKRALPDSPDSRRPKRAAPAATMSSTPDAASAAYVESAVEAAQAAAQAATHADFAALQQATAERHEPPDPANASSTAAAALGSMYPAMHLPQSTEETFAGQNAAENENHSEPSYEHNELGLGDASSASNIARESPHNSVRSGLPYQPCSNSKPAVGSEEWHKLRKDNHKNVERRRRETINEGINELGKIVPDCEKNNKGKILQRAVSYISELREEQAAKEQKWNLEKLLTDQALRELSMSHDRLKQECERAYRELTIWKQVAQNAGLEPAAPKQEAPASTTTSSS